MKIRWSGCLVSVLGLLLAVPLLYFSGALIFLLAFNDNGSQEGLDLFDRGMLYVELGLGLAALLFFGGLFWMFSGREPELPVQETEQADAEDRP